MHPAYENFEYHKVILCKPKRYCPIKLAFGSTLYDMSYEYERKELLESKFIIKDATYTVREKIVDEIKKQYLRIHSADIALDFFCCGAALEWQDDNVDMCHWPIISALCVLSSIFLSSFLRCTRDNGENIFLLPSALCNEECQWWQFRKYTQTHLLRITFIASNLIRLNWVCGWPPFKLPAENAL